jgi:oligopeptide transport system substrate-binding protein
MNAKFRAAAALALILAAAPASAQVYMRGNDSNPETLDQHKTSTVAEAHILRDLYEGLMVYDAKAKVVPGVAESHTVSDDGTVYTFTLRGDAMWSNGDPVTAGDFVYSLQRIMTPETGAKYANILYPIKNAEKVNKGELAPAELGVKAVDDKTLEITLEQATPFFLELLTHQTGLPVHPATVEAHGSDFVKPENFVSNGAFTLTEFTPNDKLVAVKNAKYHGADSVAIDKVIFYPIEDRASCVRRFEAGEIHSCSDLPTDQIADLRAKFGDQVRTPPYLGNYYYAVNMSKPPFDDVRVRQALSMAIDREYPGRGNLGRNHGSGLFAGAAGHQQLRRAGLCRLQGRCRCSTARTRLSRCCRRPASARTTPLKLEIMYNTSENHKNTAIAIADMWKTLGVNHHDQRARPCQPLCASARQGRFRCRPRRLDRRLFRSAELPVPGGIRQ